MNSMVDDELGLGSDDELGDYDITNEREEALLEGDDEEFNEAKKPQYESDGSDVLELDYEEDFQDEESEKTVEKPERAEESKPKEQSSPNKGKSVQKPKPVSAPIRQSRPNTVSTGNKSQASRAPHYRRAGNGSQRWQRKYFQQKQNSVKDRRNATVLINPRFEGTVHIKENNARLSWDNLKYSQPSTQNPIQPWRSGSLNEPNPQNQLIVSNLVSGLASLVQPVILPPTQRPHQNFSHPPSQNFAQSTPQNFYNHQPPETAEHRLCFEPPPHLDTQMARPPPSYSSLSMPLKPLVPPPERRNYQDYSASTYIPPQGYWKSEVAPRMSYEGRNQYDTPDYNQRKPAYYGNNSNNNNSGYDFKSNYQKNESSQYNYRNEYELKNNFKTVENRRNSDFNNRNFNYNNSSYPSSKSQYSYNNESSRNDRFVGRKPVLTTIESKDVLPEKRIKVSETVSKPQVVKEQHKTAMDIHKTEDLPKKDATKIKEEKQEVEEDEEMRIYRQKIEEQKRERERILKIKEERRKQKLELKKQQDEAKLITESKKNQPNVASNSANFIPLSVQRQPNPAPQVYKKPKPTFTKFSGAKPLPPQKSNVVQPPENSSELDGMSNFTFKVANDYVPLATTSSFMSNRVVTVKTKTSKSSNTAPPVNADASVGTAVSSFFNNRKVLKKDNNFINTKLVVVSNLSANFGENKLMELSRGIGEIQTLRLDKQERQATILFKTVASAHAFFKKYQRRILDDLSVIEVKLEPMI